MVARDVWSRHRAAAPPTLTFEPAALFESPSGFAFAVFDFPFKRALFAVVLLSFMMPFESIVIPLYTLMRGLGWTDTYAALILPEVLAPNASMRAAVAALAPVPGPLLPPADLTGAQPASAHRAAARYLWAMRLTRSDALWLSVAF